jgi:hypothetical protein
LLYCSYVIIVLATQLAHAIHMCRQTNLFA